MQALTVCASVVLILSAHISLIVCKMCACVEDQAPTPMYSTIYCFTCLTLVTPNVEQSRVRFPRTPT